MKSTNQNLSLFAILFAVIALQSCKSDKVLTAPNEFTNGVFVVEQGQYTNGTGTISYLNKNTNTITKDVFGKKNGGAIGNVLQSMNIINGKAYLVVNNANKIVVCNAANMAFENTISSTKFPRYIKQINAQKAYVSEWGDSTDGAIRVLDLASKAFTKRIRVGNGAEQILVYGDRAYVTCNGAFTNSDSIAIVNINYDTLVGKIAVGANPESIVLDADNNIWILSKGSWTNNFTVLNPTGSLVRYNTFTNKIDRTFTFNSTNSQPTSLCINGAKNVMYYLYNGGLWALNSNASTLQPWPIKEGYFYGLHIDPVSDIIYSADAKDFNSNGLIRRYNTSGYIIDSFGCGVLPSEFYFTK
jgi:hypothetical protein